MAAHVIVMIFALIVNIIVSGIAMTEGTKIIAALTDGKYVATSVIINSSTSSRKSSIMIVY